MKNNVLKNVVKSLSGVLIKVDKSSAKEIVENNLRSLGFTLTKDNRDYLEDLLKDIYGDVKIESVKIGDNNTVENVESFNNKMFYNINGQRKDIKSRWRIDEDRDTVISSREDKRKDVLRGMDVNDPYFHLMMACASGYSSGRASVERNMGIKTNGIDYALGLDDNREIVDAEVVEPVETLEDMTTDKIVEIKDELAECVINKLSPDIEWRNGIPFLKLPNGKEFILPKDTNACMSILGNHFKGMFDSGWLEKVRENGKRNPSGPSAVLSRYADGIFGILGGHKPTR